MNNEVKDELNTDQKISIITTAVTGATGGGVIGALIGGPVGAIIGGLFGSIISGYSDYQHQPHHTHTRRRKTARSAKK
jgi:uncharacterized membrane protein